MNRAMATKGDQDGFRWFQMVAGEDTGHAPPTCIVAAKACLK